MVVFQLSDYYLGGASDKEPCNAGALRSLGQEDPLEGRAWQPTLVFLPGESHELRSLLGYSPKGRKELVANSWTRLSD